ACGSARVGGAPRPIASTPIASTGPFATRFLATPGFAWHSFASPHARLHLGAGMSIARVDQLADSVDRAREVVLASLDEADVAGEASIELVLGETRDDMQRRAGRPAAGHGFSDELTA